MPIYLLPISHIAFESRQAVENAFQVIRPEILAVELDRARLFALVERRNSGSLGPNRKRNFHFHLQFPKLKESLLALFFGVVQSLLGRKVGEIPGEEFLIAIETSARSGAEVFLIDQDVSVTLSNLSKRITFGTVLKALRLSFFPRKSQKFELDLSKVPEEKLIRKLLSELKREFPGVYGAIVSDRDRVMAGELRRIVSLRGENSAILAVVGAAHIPGLRRLLKGATVLSPEGALFASKKTP